MASFTKYLRIMLSAQLLVHSTNLTYGEQHTEFHFFQVKNDSNIYLDQKTTSSS